LEYGAEVAGDGGSTGTISKEIIRVVVPRPRSRRKKKKVAACRKQNSLRSA
jgi:hypothetical protein